MSLCVVWRLWWTLIGTTSHQRTAQRLAALALLHKLYQSGPSSTKPFALFFVEMLQPTIKRRQAQTGASATEHWFLSQILTHSFPEGLYKKTPAAILNMERPELLHGDMHAIVATLMEGHREIGAYNMVGL